MTKHKEKEKDIIEQKDIEKEAGEEVSEIKHAKEDLEIIEKLKEAEKQASEYLNGWKRAQADFENYKKQQARMQKDFLQFASVNLIMQILPVLDNFHASTDHIPEDQKNNQWVVGIMHIQKQLEKVLEDNGVSEIKVKEGDEFDPAMHEAVKQEERSKKKEESEFKNKIIKVIQKGYKIDNKIIRPARVVVE